MVDKAATLPRHLSPRGARPRDPSAPIVHLYSHGLDHGLAHGDACECDSLGIDDTGSGSGRALADPGAIAMVGANTVGIAYIQNSGSSWRVHFRRSTDGGATWRTAVPVSQTTGQPVNVSMAAAGSRFDIVWNQRIGGTARVWYAGSTDGGVTWGAKKSLSPSTHHAYDPRVARDTAGRVAVVWAGGPSGQTGNIWTRVSTDSGTTFGSRVALNTATAPSALPVVAISKYGKVHVAYNAVGGVWYQRSGDGGASWTNAKEVATGTENSASPALAASGMTVMIGFTRSANGDAWIKFRRSTNNGLAWEAARQLASQAANDTRAIVLSVRSGHWRALYARCTTSSCSDDAIATYLRQSNDAGAHWAAAERVSPTTHDNAVPIGADGGAKTVVAWQRQDVGGSILRVYSSRAT